LRYLTTEDHLAAHCDHKESEIHERNYYMKKIFLSFAVAASLVATGELSHAKTKRQKTVKETPTSTETSTETTTTPEVTPTPPPPAEPAPVVVEEKKDDAQHRGGLFLEPSLFYETGKGEIDWGSINAADGNIKGLGVGLRFGVHISDIVFIAADGMYSKPKFTDDSGNNFDAKTKSWLAGLTVGAQTPYYGIRVWGGYMPFGQIELDGRNTSTNVRFTEPKIWKFGAGIRYNIVSINLEYLNGKYNSMDALNAGFLTGNYSSATATRNSWIVSVSFPLAL
jgi:hypothetical protein